MFGVVAAADFPVAGRIGDLIGDAKTTLLVGDSLLDLILGRGVGDLGRFGVDERLRGERRLAADRSRLAGCLADVAGRREVNDCARGERALDVEALGAGDRALGLGDRAHVERAGGDGAEDAEDSDGVGSFLLFLLGGLADFLRSSSLLVWYTMGDRTCRTWSFSTLYALDGEWSMMDSWTALQMVLSRARTTMLNLLISELILRVLKILSDFSNHS